MIRQIAHPRAVVAPAVDAGAPVANAVRRYEVDVRTAGITLTGISAAAFAGGVILGFQIAVIIATIAAIAAAATMVRSPGVGLLGIGMLCTLDLPARVYVFVDGGLPYNSVNYIYVLLGLMSVPHLRALRDAQSKWLAAFTILLILQLIPTSNLRLGALSTLEVICAFALTACFARGAHHKSVLHWMAVLNAVTATGCVFLYLVRTPGELLLNPNSMGQIIVGGLASIALAASVTGAIRDWRVIGALTTIQLMLVFLSQSRGAFIISVLLGMYILFRSPRMAARSYILVLLAAVFAWGTMTFTEEYGSTLDKWNRLFDPSLTLSQATNSRVDVVEIGWTLFQANPVGRGTGSFTDVSALGGRDRLAAHSAWVKTMAENGIPGLLLLAAYVLSFSWTRNRYDRDVSSMLGVFVTVTLALGFMVVEFQSKSLWLLAAGATVLLHRRGEMADSECQTPRPQRIGGYRSSVLRIPNR